MKGRLFDAFLTFLAGTLIFAAGYAIGQSNWAPIKLTGAAATTPADAREAFVPFWEVWHLIENDYVDRPVDPDLLVEGAITGMLAVLDDPHTAYLAPEEQRAAEDAMQGQLQGIGAEVESIDGALTIVSPFDGSPAAKAGLQPRDIIREVNGVEVTGLPAAEAAALIRGPAGTDVDLLIEREAETFDVTITRGVIDIPSISLTMLEESGNQLAHLRLSRFGERTTTELREALETVNESGADGLILDLRRNPGGSLNTVVDVADQFLDGGVILTEDFGGGREKIFEAEEEGLAQNIPLVVLVDEGSASASEVLAGALRDQGRATIIGTTTFGKGTVQSWNTLRNGGGVRITIARWLTPNGSWVHETGLQPEIEIARNEETAADVQLEAAIELLENQLQNAATVDQSR